VRSQLANPSGFTHYSWVNASGGFMHIVRSRSFCLGLAFAASLSFSSMLPTPGEAYTAEEQQACSGDAFRLCSSEIPDVDRVTACMIGRKSQLSPGCRVFFRPGPEPVADGGAPLNIKPVTARRHVTSRPHKSRKKPSAS
jgi:hypothetical protein